MMSMPMLEISQLKAQGPQHPTRQGGLDDEPDRPARLRANHGNAVHGGVSFRGRCCRAEKYGWNAACGVDNQIHCHEENDGLRWLHGQGQRQGHDEADAAIDSRQQARSQAEGVANHERKADRLPQQLPCIGVPTHNSWCNWPRIFPKFATMPMKSLQISSPPRRLTTRPALAAAA